MYTPLIYKRNKKNLANILEEDICRLCWRKHALKDIYPDTKSKVTLADDILYCLDIVIAPLAHFQKICATCMDSLKKFKNFKSFCKKTNEELEKHFILDQNYMGEKQMVSVKLEKRESVSLESEKSEIKVCEKRIQGVRDLEKRKSIKKSILSSDIANQSTEITSVSENAKLISVKIEPIEDSCSENDKDDVLEEFVDTFEAESKQSNSSKSKLDGENDKLKQSNAKICNFCCLQATTVEELTKHRIVLHGYENSQFKCYGCERRFMTRQARRNHENDCVSNVFKCHLCDCTFIYRRYLERHILTHLYGDKALFKCRYCEKTYDAKEALWTHMKSHNKEQQLVCETCGRVFSRTGYLKIHMATHNGVSFHQCPHCPYKTPHGSSLVIHVRKHTGERPYPCDLCPQKCVSISNLHAHRRRHLGIKNHHCMECGKSFGYKTSLTEHIDSVHRGLRCACPACGVTYTRRMELKRHFRKKHPQNDIKMLKSVGFTEQPMF